MMDDYVHCFMAYLTALPELTLSLPLLHLAVSHTLAALTCPAPETVLISLDVLTSLCRLVKPPTPSSPQSPYQATLEPIFAQYGSAIIKLTIGGVVQGFPEDCMEQVKEIVETTLMACAGGVAPDVLESWVREAIDGIPGYVVPQNDRVAFLGEVHE